MSNTIQKPTPNAPKEVYVLHILPSRARLTFNKFQPAYKEFVKRLKTGQGSVALWRGPVWTKLHASDTYPPALTEPFLSADV